MRVVVISGTPGVGKTTIALELGRLLRARVLHLGEFIEQHSLQERWDAQKETSIVDEDVLRNALLSEIDFERKKSAGFFIIEGLMVDIVASVADHAVVLRLDPRVLKHRLEARRYKKLKVEENLQAELLGTCTYHMIESIGKNFADVDTTDKNVTEVVQAIHGIISGKTSPGEYRPGKIDWISTPGIDPASFFA